MMIIRQALTTIVIALTWIILTTSASFAATKVSPVRVQVDPKGRGVVTVTNAGERESLYKINAFAWVQNDGKDVMTPTKEFIASPPSFTLKPGQKRDIRIGFRSSKRVAVERTYRLSIQEIPSRVQIEGADLALSVSVKHLIPVFVAPADQDTAPRPVWSARKAGDSIIVRCDNLGQRHYSFQRLAFGKSNNSKGKPSFSVDLNGTVLPGGWREWSIKIPVELRRKPIDTIEVGFPRQKEPTSYPLKFK